MKTMVINNTMDLTQRKLTKQEWEGIEVPVSNQEKTILKMISEGFTNVDLNTIIINHYYPLLSLIKMMLWKYVYLTNTLNPDWRKYTKKLR